jgi:chemotaxis signal transduction protein
VAGLLPGDPPLTVVSPLHAEGRHIIVLETSQGSFGLLVDVVTGLQKVEDHHIRPSPQGQGRTFVSGTFDRDGRLVLVADPVELGAAL